MIDGMQKYIELFNREDNQNVSRFGLLNSDLLTRENNSYEILYYFYPMIERIIRCILDQSGVFDMENADHYVFKTLNSIITQNGDKLKEVFKDEDGEDILYYLNDTYSENGIRNKVMHYFETTEIDTSAILSAKYIFSRLIQFYVDNYNISD